LFGTGFGVAPSFFGDFAMKEPLDEHAKAVGYVCFHWAALEHGIDGLLGVLVEDPTAAECIAVNARFTEKLNMLRALGSLRKRSDAWYDELELFIRLIDSCRSWF
jgi:hypothetical protein